MSHKILITGGAGFIGSHLAGEFLHEGHSVAVLDNLDPYYDVMIKKRNLSLIGERGEFEFIRGDVLDTRLLEEIFSGNDFNIVIHNAAQPGVRISLDDPAKTNRINVEGTLNVLRSAVQNGMGRVINASSSTVYGSSESLPSREHHSLQPASPYGVSKMAAEKYGKVFHEMYGLDVISLRYFTVYGPRMRPDLAISKFVRRAIAGQTIEIYGSGEQTRDFTHIHDIVDANRMFMDGGRSGTYNIGTGKSYSINYLVEMIRGFTDSDVNVENSDIRKGEVEHTLASISLAESEVGWKPTISLEEGLREYVEFVKKEIDGR